jgi:hypothetical protein
VLVEVCIVSSTGLFEVGGSEYRSSFAVSRRTGTGTASVSGRASAKVFLFGTAKNRQSSLVRDLGWMVVPRGLGAGRCSCWWRHFLAEHLGGSIVICIPGPKVLG